MGKILNILQSEYSSEYFLKRYSKPKIYPSVITEKPLSSFTSEEKKALMEKGKRWYIYYDFMNDNGEMIRQPPIYYNINRAFKDFNSKFKQIKLYRNSVENILKQGFSPFENEHNTNEYSAKYAIEHALSLLKLELKSSSYNDYNDRCKPFLKYLAKKGLDNKSIKKINKKVVNDYLNIVLKQSSAGNRNNAKSGISAVFTKLANEDFIETNFIKGGIANLKSLPKKNAAFTQEEVKEIFKKAKKDDIWLYYFIAHVYYGLFRNIEVVRIQIPNVKLKDKLIKSDTKTWVFHKQIPQILIDEFYSKIDLTKYPDNYFVFTKDNKPSEWLTPRNSVTGLKTVTKEKNRRGYWGKRFNKVIKQPMNFSSDYSIYSLRHSAIGKLFIEKVKQYQKEKAPNFEEKALDYIRKITDHQDNKIVKNYLREIGYYKIDDWSDVLK